MTLSTESGEDTIADAVEPAPEHESDSSEDNQQPHPTTRRGRGIRWSHVLCFGVLPLIVVILAAGAGYLKWLSWSQSQQAIAQTESVRAATEATVAMLSYKPDTANNDLDAAKSRLTGSFRDSYSSLIDDVVAPAAIQKLITAKAQVPAAASVSASASHAVVLVFVNQTVTVGNDAPSNTTSSVKVTLDRINGRWLISGFDPV